MDQKITSLYKEYTSGKITRREFFKKATIMVGSTATVIAILPALEGNDAIAQIIPEDDPRLHIEMIEYTGETGAVLAYLAKPKEGGRLPGVIVIHENKGLQPHIKDVTRRMALEGFVSIAPDALSPLGGTPDDLDKARSMMRELDGETTKKDFIAAVKYLKTNPLTTGKVGCTGFCWGGAMTNQVAVNAQDLAAAVPYYGRQPETEDVSKIKASVMAHYGGTDERINAGIPDFEKALKKANVEYKIYIYDGAPHAFNNDSNPGRYHKEAAELAWKRTIEFFKEKLQS